MKRFFFFQTIIIISMLLAASHSVLAHGTTDVVFGFPASIDQDVPASCLTDLNSCAGTFAIINQNDFPYLNKISIAHSDPPSGIFQSCHKVAYNPSGYVVVYGDRVAPNDKSRALYFTLKTRPLCSFNPSDIRWFNNSEYQSGNFEWTSTRPAIIDPADIQTMCRNNKGKTVTIVKKFQASLLYNNGDQEQLGPTASLHINFHCAPAPPFIGCYKDYSNRKLPVVLSSSSVMTIEQCVTAAHNQNLTYAGVQFGGQCYGGNTLMSSDFAENQSDCNMPCNSDKSEICGGSWRNSVYYAKGDANWHPTYLGCYVDDSSRKLPFVLSSSSTMTVEQCIAAARAQGLAYAGLQFGGQCYGGNTVTNATKVNQSECKMSCNADKNETCGDGWRNSVYLTGYPPTSCSYADLTSDVSNCGSCGHVCASNQSCQNSQCTSSQTCTGGLTKCSGACVNLSTSNTNCGSCGHTCASGQSCQNSQCVSSQTCTGGLTKCSGACVNLSTSNTNCGSCGHTCASGQSCQNSQCMSSQPACPSQTPTRCNGICVNTLNDHANCAYCGNACGSSQSCQGGKCTCASPMDECGPNCYNPASEQCMPGNIPCPLNWELCGSKCYNPSSEQCMRGNIVCLLNWELCGSQCFNPSVDQCMQPGNVICPLNWGLCGSKCFNTTLYYCQGGKLCSWQTGQCN